MEKTNPIPNAPGYEYIGENQCKALARGGTTIVLEKLTDRKIARLIAKDEYWLTHFKAKAKKAPQRASDK